MISGLIVSAVVPFLIAKFGGGLISALLIKAGASQGLALTVGPQIADIASKLLGGQALTPEELQALEAHRQQAKPKQVSAHPGATFHPV